VLLSTSNVFFSLSHYSTDPFNWCSILRFHRRNWSNPQRPTSDLCTRNNRIRSVKNQWFFEGSRTREMARQAWKRNHHSGRNILIHLEITPTDVDYSYENMVNWIFAVSSGMTSYTTVFETRRLFLPRLLTLFSFTSTIWKKQNWPVVVRHQRQYIQWRWVSTLLYIPIIEEGGGHDASAAYNLLTWIEWRGSTASTSKSHNQVCNEVRSPAEGHEMVEILLQVESESDSTEIGT